MANSIADRSIFMRFIYITLSGISTLLSNNLRDYRALCFVDMPYGKKTDLASRIEINFDQIYESAIKPAVIELFNLIWACSIVVEKPFANYKHIIIVL